MKVFDANLILGRLGWRPIGVESADEMLRALDRFAIERGLVSHLTACVHEPEAGNRALFAAVAGHEDRLLPVPVVDLNDEGRWVESLPEWAGRGTRALRIAPAFYRHRVDGPEATALAQTAGEHGWPVVVALNSVRGVPWASGQMAQAQHFARAFPDVKVLALGANRSQWYEIQSALHDNPNLYLELSGLETGLAAEQLVAAGFGNRLLHGSNHGMSYANVCLERVRCSSLSETDKGSILWHNSLALLGEG